MSNQSKKFHFSPLLGIILTTTTVWVTDDPVRGQNVPSVASIKDPEGTTFELMRDLGANEASTVVDPYPQVSAIREGVRSHERGSVSSTHSVTEQAAARDFNEVIISDPWLDESSDTVESYPKVSSLKETTDTPEITSVESDDSGISDPQLNQSSDTVESYPKVFTLKETIATPEITSVESDDSGISDPQLNQSSDRVESYPKVSTLKETIATPETASKASVESDDSLRSDPQLNESSDRIESDPKVSTSENLSEPDTAILQEHRTLTTANGFGDESLSPSNLDKAIAAELTTEQETAQETTPAPEPPVVPVPETIPPPETETEETETTGEEPRVLVVEVVVEGAGPELEDLVYNTIQTRPGRTATRSQLQEDVNAIYATGYFANVEVTPSDTPLGVRISYNVEVNPILEQVVVNTVPDVEDQRALPPEKVEEIFADQYGETLNLRELQEGIRAINEWYAEQGFDLAQVIGSPEVSEDGIVTLVIAEGVIEDVQVRFFDAEDEPVDGRTRDFIVTREMQLEPGDVFNRRTAQFDLQRIFGLGLFEDVRISFSPGEDPEKLLLMWMWSKETPDRWPQEPGSVLVVDCLEPLVIKNRI